jgi:hypothetical protein
VHNKSVTTLEIPAAEIQFLEEYESDDESTDIALSAWPIEEGRAGFAGLQFIDRAPWLVHGTIARTAGGLLDVQRLTVEAWKHEGEVTGRVLRRVRPAHVREEALARLRFIGTAPDVYFGGPDERPVRVFPPDEREARTGLVAAADAPRKRGRPGLATSHYRGIALEYLQLYESGSSAPVREIAERRGVPWQTVRDWVARARKLGYLTHGKQGRSGADPGPRLLREPDENPS